MPTLWVLGARSDIARATTNRFAEKGWSCLLAGRHVEELTKDAADLRIRHGVTAEVLAFDVLAEDAVLALPADHLPDAVLCAVGLLDDQTLAERDRDLASAILSTNFTALVPVLEHLAAGMVQRGSGSLMVISSVAGDRGRGSNYIYGSAKAGLSAYLSGLRNRLSKSGVHVLTIKPGFVATSMTADLNLPSRLTARPARVAGDIEKAWRKRRDVLYTPWFWRWIMLVIRLIPEKVFKKLNL